MERITFPESFKIVEAIPNQTAAAGADGDYVSLKNAVRAWIVVNLTQGNAATVALTVEKATAVAGTGSVAITTAVPIWSNLDTAASDTLVRRTDAVAYTTDAGVKNKQVIFQIDPRTLGEGFTCICVKAGASNAANILGAQYILQTTYPSATPPAAITD